MSRTAKPMNRSDGLTRYRIYLVRRHNGESITGKYQEQNFFQFPAQTIADHIHTLEDLGKGRISKPDRS